MFRKSVLGGAYCLHLNGSVFYHEDGDNMVLRNVVVIPHRAKTNLVRHNYRFLVLFHEHVNQNRLVCQPKNIMYLNTSNSQTRGTGYT
jgi:hypothetical protein